MAKQGQFAIKLDVSQIDALADRLGQIDADSLSKAVVFAINETADEADNLSKRRMLSGINLSEDYVARRIQRVKATAGRPVAEIIAPVGKTYFTNLSHYDPQQMLTGVKFPKKSKGNLKIGIPPGQKANGRSVAVVKGQRKRVVTAFALPGKTDSEGNLLMFQRQNASKNPDPKGRIKALTGPSVYQLFRIAADELVDDVGGLLETNVVAEANKIMEKVFK